MNFPMLLAWLVVFIAVPVVWLGTVLLILLMRARPDNGVLRAQALSAVFTSYLITAFGLVFVNNDMRPPPLTLQETQVITRTAVLAQALPMIYWLRLALPGALKVLRSRK